MSTLSELLAEPSVENWKEIVEIGKQSKRVGGLVWTEYTTLVSRALVGWPPEIERICPSGWPKEFKDAVERCVRETDTYSHYIAKICRHPNLRLSDGTQAVWLERRFTGGVVPVSTVQQALRCISASRAAPSVAAAGRHIEQARNILTGGVRNIGKVGCADLTGGLVAEKKVSFSCAHNLIKHEYRLEVEIKVGDEPQRPEQVARMRSVQARGGCYVLARSVEEAVTQIRAFIASVS